MSSRVAVISLVALCLIFLLILKNYETWTRPIETVPERTSVKKQEAKIENPPAVRPQKVAAIAQPNAATISGKNIFSPDRKDFPVQSSETRKIVRPQIILYGVTIAGDYQFASIVNPGRRLLRGEREMLSVKIGDKVGDYKLANISSDRITLEAEGDVFEVLLYDPKTPKKRMEVRTETKPAAGTSTLPTVPTPTPQLPTGQPPKASAQGTVPTPPPVAARPVPTPTPPPQVPRPILPGRRGRMMYYPGTGTSATPGTPATPATPAPEQEEEGN